MGLETVFKTAAETAANIFTGIFVPIEYKVTASTSYDPESGLVLASSTYENTKMMFENYKQYQVDNDKILPTDVKGVIPQNDLTAVPKVGDIIFKIGDNEITDGGFDDATAWDIGAGWSVSSSLGSSDGTSSNSLAQGSATLAYTNYIVGYDASLSAGILNARLQGQLIHQHTASAIAFKDQVTVGNGENNISFDSQNSPNQFNGYVDSVVAYPILAEYDVINIMQDPAGALWELQLRQR